MAPESIVIVGSGMAGGVAARTFREEGYDGSIALVGDEPGVPFGRPPLSKSYLRGEEGLEGWLVEPDDWYRRNGVELIRASATRLDTKRRRVELDGGEALEYSKLLIATGGRNRPVGLPGSDRQGIFQLRTVAGCDAIKAAARAGGHAAVVGMGFIGCEVAASLRQIGLDVSAIWPGRYPLGSVLGPEVGEAMARIHADEGVQLIPGETVERFDGADVVERVVMRSGRSVECDLAIVAVGIQPNVELLRGTDVAVDDGILVDSSCRTNVPDVFAAGDVANHLHPIFGRVRVEHYNNAEKQGAAAARSMLGSQRAYAYVHTFWSDQYEHKLEYVGHTRRWDRLVIRGSVQDLKLIGFYLEGGAVRAAVGLDRGGDPELDTEGEMAKAGRLVARQARPLPSDLADESLDLALL